MDINIVVGVLHISTPFNPTMAFSNDKQEHTGGDQVTNPSVPLDISSKSPYIGNMVKESKFERTSEHHCFIDLIKRQRHAQTKIMQIQRTSRPWLYDRGSCGAEERKSKKD
jgi:hypothetical protein